MDKLCLNITKVSSYDIKELRSIQNTADKLKILKGLWPSYQEYYSISDTTDEDSESANEDTDTDDEFWEEPNDFLYNSTNGANLLVSPPIIAIMTYIRWALNSRMIRS